MLLNRWFSTTALALLVAIAACVGVHAQNFTVTDVDVDVTAADALQAREQGIREARRKAAVLLVARMVPAEDRAKVATPDDARLESMVRGIEFVRERTAPGRYIATLNVVFSPGPVKAWLGEGGAKTAETVSRPALVIPLWKGPSGVEPLDDRNAWREAWRALDTAGSAVPLTLLRGDQLDQNAVTAEQAYVGDVSALARLVERYRTPVIVVAVVEGDKDAGPLTVSGLRYDAQTGARSEIAKETVPGAAELGEAARKMHARLDEQWRSMATVRRDSQDALEVYVPIRALGDWVQVRQRLGAVPAVKNIQVRTLEADRADLRLEYFGTPEELQRILAQAGLTLDRDADKWRLQAR
ncbi:MAG: DUF2066 domain-containing protein [Reyranellaceae bacterium]